jgi:hypothetical protein
MYRQFCLVKGPTHTHLTHFFSPPLVFSPPFLSNNFTRVKLNLIYSSFSLALELSRTPCNISSVLTQIRQKSNINQIDT